MVLMSSIFYSESAKSVMGNPCLEKVTEAQIDRETSRWMRNWRDRRGGKKIHKSFHQEDSSV